MTGKWETVIGQLRLVQGNRVENPANLGVVERRLLLSMGGRGKGHLYVLVELGGSAFGREELCQDLVSAIAEEYMHSAGTVTYGLRQAVLLANASLWRANSQGGAEKRLGGAACVVLRGGEAFVAQAGWPMVYLVHHENVHAFPDTVLEDEDTTMLGQRQTTEVRLFHTAIQPGDTILMLDGPMARQLGSTRIGQIVSGGVEQALSNLETLAPPEDCTAMVVQVGTPTDASVQSEQWAFTPVETPASEALASPVATVSATVAETETIAVPIAELAEPSSVPEAEEVSTPFVEEQPMEPSRHRRHDVQTGSGAGNRIAAVLGVLGSGLRTFVERLLPDRGPERSASQRRRPTARARRARSQEAEQIRWRLVFAVAIPLLALIIAGGYALYHSWSLRARFTAYLDKAKIQRVSAANASDSPTVARDYWLEVIANVAAAEKLQPTNPELKPLRNEAELALDRIDGITRLTGIYKLFEYVTPGSAPSRVIVSGLDAYVLDRGAGRVYHHALNETRTALRNASANQVLVQQGQSINGPTLGPLIDIAWAQSGGERQAGALLILDRDGLLVEYDPAWEKLSTQRIGGREAWRAPAAVRTFDSNLYLLDPSANQIFKYWSKRYAEQPDRWIKQTDVDLSKAADIGIDGSIYVLYSDGRMSKHYAGEPRPFAQTRVPKPLTSGSALYLDIQDIARYTYIADPSDMRIVQLDREGLFIREFQPSRDRANWLVSPTGTFVDETGGKLYYVATNALYVADIPPVQR